MKIVNRGEFLKLPENTLYAKIRDKWIIDDLCQKGESWTNDWWYRSFNWVDADNSEEAIRRLEEMADNGASYPMEKSYGRDGLYEDGELFAIYEEADIKDLQQVCKEALEALLNNNGSGNTTEPMPDKRGENNEH